MKGEHRSPMTLKRISGQITSEVTGCSNGFTNCHKSMSTDQYCLIDIQKRFQLDAICERFYVSQLLILSFLLNDLQYIVVLQRTRKQHVEMKNLCNTVIFLVAKEPHSNTRILQKFFNELLDQRTLFKSHCCH